MSGGSKNGDYWPGFVDALTNVVIAMVFVIVVLAIALSFSAQLLAKRMAAKIAQMQETPGLATVARPASSSPTPLPAAPPAALDARVPMRIRIAVAGTLKPASAPAPKLQTQERYLQLDFANGALTLDDAANAQLVQALASVKQQLAALPPGARVAVVAVGPEMQLSENQRSAFIRAMAVRNVLLDQGVAAARIDTRVDVRAAAAAASVTIRIEEEAK